MVTLPWEFEPGNQEWNNLGIAVRKIIRGRGRKPTCREYVITPSSPQACHIQHPLFLVLPKTPQTPCKQILAGQPHQSAKHIRTVSTMSRFNMVPYIEGPWIDVGWMTPPQNWKHFLKTGARSNTVESIYQETKHIYTSPNFAFKVNMLMMQF